MDQRNLPLEELIDQLRRAAATWFKNSDLLLLEELIRRIYVYQTNELTLRKQLEKSHTYHGER